MYAVSPAWVAAQKSFIAPEGLVEISCYVPELKDTLVYTKKDLLSFTHQQTGSLVSGELPKNHIEFSLDNSDGRWNPNNPRGMERYLSERLKVTLRYGYIINGIEEWIPGGVFYLSEWRTSPNGLEANFTARDILEYMIDTPYTGEISGTLYDIAQRAIEEANLPIDQQADVEPFVIGESELGSATLGLPTVSGVSISERLKDYSVGDIEYNGNDTIAVILQKCANAAGCVMYQDRNAAFIIGNLSYDLMPYVIPKKLSYSYPEIEFSRPIKNVSVTYFGDEVSIYPFSSVGETQTLNNDFIATKEQADMVAKWVCDTLRTRQHISGEYRGDPRLDLFDVVYVENKYGTVAGVVLTDIKCTFTGAFRTTYTGYVRGSGTAVMVHCGEIYTGEVV